MRTKKAKYAARLPAALVALVLVGCGGGGSGSSNGQAAVPPPPQLPAPILYEQGASTLVKIPDPDIACTYKIYINNGGSVSSIVIGSQDYYTSPINNTSTSYAYTCTKNNQESPQSRAVALQGYELIDYGYRGALSIDDFNKDGVYELLGTLSAPNGLTTVTETNLGLGPLNRTGRVYRDIRFADLDNDGNLDAIANVYSENYQHDSNYNSYVQLYWGTADGKFVLDQAFENLRYTGYGETIVVADLDNNGYLDILIPQYKIPGSSNEFSRNLLFKNNGERNLQEVAVNANVVNTFFARAPEGAQAVDINLDGYIDLYVGGSLLKNNGNFTFTDITTMVGLPGSFEEGAKFFDYDLDGDLDFIISPSDRAPRVFKNSNGLFAEVTSSIFPSEYFQYVYGMNVGDFNNDGYDDVLLAGGIAANGEQLAPRLYLNLNGTFVRQTFLANISRWSDLQGFADLNNDGALDIVTKYGTMGRVINANVPNGYIKLTVLGSGLRNQHGRIVKVRYPAGKTKAYVVDGGSGYMSNQPYEILIPNDAQLPLEINVMCAAKTISFTASTGSFVKDCN